MVLSKSHLCHDALNLNNYGKMAVPMFTSIITMHCRLFLLTHFELWYTTRTCIRFIILTCNDTCVCMQQFYISYFCYIQLYMYTVCVCVCVCVCACVCVRARARTHACVCHSK